MICPTFGVRSESQKLAEQKQKEAEENLKKFEEQQGLTKQAETGRDQEAAKRQEADKSRDQAVKTSSEIRLEKVQGLMARDAFAEAYSLSIQLTKEFPNEAEGYGAKLQAAIQTACFNLTSALDLLKKSQKNSLNPERDQKLLDVLIKFESVAAKLPNSLLDRELQLALIANILSVEDPDFTVAANYLRKTNPKILYENIHPKPTP